MMPQRAQNRPICPHCDGFPLVAITTGQHTPDGHRETINAACRPCHGTGRTNPSAAVPAHAGR